MNELAEAAGKQRAQVCGEAGPQRGGLETRVRQSRGDGSNSIREWSLFTVDIQHHCSAAGSSSDSIGWQ
eukprot:6013451-Pyramimonas_sp.AAC.1